MFNHICLKSGIPLHKADGLRELLERMAWVLRSLSSTHLHQLVHVPFILNEEILIIKQEILEDHISISFNGTTHAAEAFVVVQHLLTVNGVLNKELVG